MLEVYGKAVFFAEVSFQGREKVFIAIYGFAADAAYQMVVVLFVGVVVNQSVSYLAFIDAAGFLQKLQGAVDGRFADALNPGLDAGYDFFCGEAAGVIVQYIGNQPALGRQFQPLFFHLGNATHSNYTWSQL
jgi:hypothetical protein